jgi:anhydro-N-acetylmuramic acid kinase
MVDGHYIGQMSGTSLDGIDTAIIEIQNGRCTLIENHSLKWPQDIEQRLRHLIEQGDSLDEMLQLDQLCAQYFSQAALECLEKIQLNPDDVKAIGCHGQTIRHSPNSDPAYSLQIGNANSIAEITGITTITDFRSRDIAAGGQGAPLAPAFHAAVFSEPEKRRVVLNIGGIANITILTNEELKGFDTGPGNRLLDDWIRRCKNLTYDKNGAFAASGKTHSMLLSNLLNDPYFRLAAPKSTGSDYFNLNWLEQHLINFSDEAAENIQATLAVLTATSIGDQVKQAVKHCDEVLVCGGGVHNTFLMKLIEQQLPNSIITSTETYGIHPDWVEAMAFAWLAQQTLSGLPGNVANVTGAKGPRICGAISQK